MSRPHEVLRRRGDDVVLFGTVLALLSIGLVMVYSASSVVAYERLSDSAYFFKRQAAWAGLGLVALWVARGIYYERLRRLAVPLLFVSVVLLAAVLIPGIGREAGGARRWITAGPLSFQPVEIAKLGVLLYVAQFAARRGAGIRNLARGVVPPLVVTALCAALVLKQPDMGSAMMLVAVTMLVLFLAGARVAHLALVLAAAAPFIAAAVVLAHYRLQRILGFLDPWSDPQGRGFHVIQSLLAFGSGGVLGVGLGASSQKFFYLPERHTDFIFSIIGEELGLLGTGGLLALFALFTYRGFSIARAAPDRFSALLAAGITATVTGQALLNMGVATGLLPVTGIPLPFVSFGGSSLGMMMIKVGILLNISQYAHRAAPAARRRPADALRARAWGAAR
ncbi:MAG: putative lipid II flippase FtsW [Armatimonadota bacterium]|nr:putative lipid II flippase FtsW [Armatimonadota bacterium]